MPVRSAVTIDGPAAVPNSTTASLAAGGAGGPPLGALLEVACGDFGADIQPLTPTAARPPTPANADRRVTVREVFTALPSFALSDSLISGLNGSCID